jgi:hypothetical protein
LLNAVVARTRHSCSQARLLGSFETYEHDACASANLAERAWNPLPITENPAQQTSDHPHKAEEYLICP